MSRSLRVDRLPAEQPTIRFSGYLTDPSLTDAQVASALTPFFLGVELWRATTQLPSDWLSRDDSVLQGTVRGPVPIWGQGRYVSSETVIGDPETPWRLLVGDGQLVVANVWLYDAQASPWPASACAACQTGVGLLGSAVVDSFAPRAITRGGIVRPLIGV